MDPLSHILALLRPQAVDWRVIEAPLEWSFRFVPDPNVVIFGQAIQGGFDMVRDDGQELRGCEGDFMLMVSPPPWVMRRPGGGPSLDFKTYLADPKRYTAGCDPATITRFIGGHFTFAAEGAELLGRLMLPSVHVRAADVASGRLGTLLGLIGDEAQAARPGAPQVVKRLLEVLLVEALRHPGLGWRETDSGLLAGLADPRIGQALKLMHQDVARLWSVGDLAHAVGMSRSAFAERFAERVGLPPREYLAGWRMTLAKQALLEREAPMMRIAELAGYQSVSAFSTAFRRLTGAAPTAYVRSSMTAS